MKIYPIQTGTVRVKQFQLTGARNNLSRFYQLLFTQKWSAWMPIYCWLIELENQLVLVDTGETTQIYKEGYLPKGGLYHKAVQSKIVEEEEVLPQINKLGFESKDIDTVILTHLHGDHIGGIRYFEHAAFYVAATEYQYATSKKGPGAGYFSKNWPKWFKPTLVSYDDKACGAFKSSFMLPGSDGLYLVPTPGHSVGHQSVIIKSGSQQFFIGGDLTYNLSTLDAEIPNVVLLNKEAKASVKMAKQYTSHTKAVYLSSHDWNVKDRLQHLG